MRQTLSIVRPIAPATRASSLCLQLMSTAAALTIGNATLLDASAVPTSKVSYHTHSRTSVPAHTAPTAAGAPKRPPATRYAQRADVDWAPFAAKVAELGLSECDEEDEASS